MFCSEDFALGLVFLRVYIKLLASGCYKTAPFSREGRYINHIS